VGGEGEAKAKTKVAVAKPAGIAPGPTKARPTKTESTKARPARRRKRRPSQSREAVRARRRRREQRGIQDQLDYERQEARERASARRRAKRMGARPVTPDERKVAIGWLGEVRNIVASVFPCSLDVTEAVSSSKGDEEDDPDGAIRQRENMRTPWLVVGRFDPRASIGYAELAQALSLVQGDLILETMINPQRLSQIRVVYADPNARRGEGDSVVSKIGAWEFILSDVVGEMMGSGADDSDALAVRYKETRIPKFYLYFSTNVSVHVTGFGKAYRWMRI
jgi:hypothetical protein